ncbi:MAG: Na+:solute symporter, partial [Planctomycetia bacterium]|nr:Na+:solute symporter [Planctomycetia bacterium]
AEKLKYLDMLPDFTNCREIAIAVFLMPIAVQWWAVWYPGSEPGGGSYVAQRMLASKSERDSLGSVLFFNVAHYVLRPWPWILTALASLIIFPELTDIRTAFPHVDPALVAHDIAYPAMMKFLPIGFFGLMVCSLIAAHSSTLLTHLNWGASYCVHDFYRKFCVPGKTERHYVLVGRFSTLLLFLGSCGLVYLLESSKAGFDLMLQIGAGTGLLYMIRWFWWRINAWCEVVAMVVSFLISILFVVGDRLAWWCGNAAAFVDSAMVKAQAEGVELAKDAVQIPMVLSTHERLLVTVVLTTVAWLLVAYLVPVSEKDRAVLRGFYRKVKPGGPGWEPVRTELGITKEEVRATGDRLPVAILGTVAGCAMIWSSLFAVGNVLYGRSGYAWVCTGVFVVSGWIVVRIVRQIWRGAPE